MDMKNEKIWNKMGRKFRSLLRNRKGMENWGLVFVVGGVALVTALTLAQQAGTSGGSFITKATEKADKVMGDYTNDDPVGEINPCGAGSSSLGASTSMEICTSRCEADKGTCKEGEDGSFYCCSI